MQFQHAPGSDANNTYGVTLQIPLFTRYYFDGEIRGAEAGLDSARETLEKARSAARSDVYQSLHEVQAAAERTRRFQQELLTAARKSADAVEFGFKNGAIGVMDVLDARRTYRATQLDAVAAQADYAKSLAAWRAAVMEEDRKMKLKTKILSATAIAALAAITVLGARELAASQAGPIPVGAGAPAEPGVVRFAVGAPQLSSLKVVAVAEVPMPVAEPSNGRISYDENVTARISSPIAGRVTASRVEIGDRVGRGATLLEIDAPELASAEADWHKARADEAYKKLAFERARKLLDNEVIARKEYEAAEAEYHQATAETKRASLRMKNLNASGNENGRFALKAPLAGVVADKQVNPGLEVRPDLPNPLTGGDRHQPPVGDRRSARAQPAGVRPGQALSIETDAYPNERFAAKVERVGLALDPETRRVQVRGAIANPEQQTEAGNVRARGLPRRQRQEGRAGAQHQPDRRRPVQLPVRRTGNGRVRKAPRQRRAEGPRQQFHRPGHRRRRPGGDRRRAATQLRGRIRCSIN